MLYFHDPLIVLLAVVIRVRDAHVEKGVLASSPESSGTNVETGIVVCVGGRAVVVLVVDFLKLGFTLNICTDRLKE